MAFADVAFSNVVEGNYIGTDAAGTSALANVDGIVITGSSYANIIGGTSAGAGNVISGNIDSGVVDINGQVNLIEGNLIGTNATATAPIGNGSDGITLSNNASDIIGGTVPAAGNVIAYNGGAGVNLINDNAPLIPINNAIRLNSIYSNTGLGIDLNDDGVTLNDLGDGDSGANDLQNFPILGSATSSSNSTTVAGGLNSTANTLFVIDFYSNPTLSPGDTLQGKTYLGSTVLTTDSSGNATFNVTLPKATADGQYVTATATTAGPLPSGDTSEFSPPVLVVSPPPVVTGVFVDGTAWTSAFLSSLVAKGMGNGSGYAIPVGSFAQLNPLAWGNLNQVSITFSQNVIVAETDLKLVGVNVANYSFANFSYNSVTDTATWTLTVPIAADKVLIDLSDSVHNSNSIKLDGEWTDTVSKTSGDGVPGGRFDFRFNVLPGDATQNGFVDNADFTYLFNHFATPSGASFADGDFDGDGDVDNADFTTLFNNFTKRLPIANPTPPPVTVATQIAARRYRKLFQSPVRFVHALCQAPVDFETFVTR